VLNSNVDSGLLNKKDELSLLIEKKDPDLIIMNEILPKRRRTKKKLTAKDFSINGYDNAVRSTTQGRGVIIYFKHSLSVHSVEVLNNFDFEESTWLSIKLKGNDNLLVGSVYRSPTSSRENNIRLNHLFQKALDTNHTHILITGDFNYGTINWELQQSPDSIDQCSSLFLESVKDLFLFQHVAETTRHRMGQSSTRLDLIFTNEINMVTDLEYLPPLGASDHSCLSFKLLCYTDFKPFDEPRPSFYKGDYPSMRDDLKSVNWGDLKNSDLDTYWDAFTSSIFESVDKHIPVIKPSHKAKKKPWLNRDAVIACEEKKRAWKSWSFCKTIQNWQSYASKRNSATRACRHAKLNFEREIAGKLKEDPKSFHSYVRSQLKTKSGIGDLESGDGSLLTSDVQKAELLNSFFASVFTDEDTTTIPTLSDRNFSSILNNVSINPDTVKKKLTKLKTTKTPGIDSIHPLLLKECADELSVVIADLFNLSLQSHNVPNAWRKAQVTPIFKKGSKRQCANYRPVSLTVILCKVLESFIRDEIMQHMESNDLFAPHQHGFRSKRSCVTQLLEVVDHWSEVIEQGGKLDCIYLDFAKAFDTVPYQRLLQKLYAYGIRSNVHGWIEAFL